MFALFKRQANLEQLPKLAQAADDLITLYSAADFRDALLDKIATAQTRICIAALYLENDDAGRQVLQALYAAKTQRPELEVSIYVDWHRAQRGRIGDAKGLTNADWYCQMAAEHPGVEIPVYGVPVNTREALGVLHLKGFVVDNTVLYSGASINDVYLHQHQKYRYDRYHLLTNPKLADVFCQWVSKHLMQAKAVNRLDDPKRPSSGELKNTMKRFRKSLTDVNYQFDAVCEPDALGVTPLVGLGKHSALNKVIGQLFDATEHKLVICTPYFNLPGALVKRILRLLRQGKTVEIIVGDKTANDFYIPPDQPFRIIGALPYLYEMNLRRFLCRLQTFVDKGQLVVRLWKDESNSYHLKGVWVDRQWLLITGNNLNPRAWRLDLENAVLIHDPAQQLAAQNSQELCSIRQHTRVVSHFSDLESLTDYPKKVRRLIRRLKRVRIDRLINRIL
ncbi:CDP-diacylglycerol--serine O-phosphatidyltransferase [Gallaecimonas mangrovi]|uniref:CDP-diacylglycerol--serine O-phosphatidyltransferase n=1 Tax=Gallaecimonas mangrovi TaxID=2291597 RepID=UPI000E20397B|nr:CDP-diacylglycerol--serine O-phosphatidyltransferase [Gallaecimonas mangrovi]